MHDPLEYLGIITAIGKSNMCCDVGYGKMRILQERQALIDAIAQQIFKGCLANQALKEAAAFAGTDIADGSHIRQSQFFVVMGVDVGENFF